MQSIILRDMDQNHKSANSPVIIIGAGFAGLVAANELKRNGIPFLLFEAGKNIGGLAQTFTDDHGFKYDLGTHIITNRLAKELDIEAECRDVPYFGESIWLNKKIYSYPFGLLGNAKYWMGAIQSRIGNLFAPKKDNLQDRFIVEYGKSFANEVAIPLIEGWAGVSACNLAPGTGDKLPGLIQTFYLKLAGFITGKAVAIGYCTELPESRKVWHVYPNDGINMLCLKLSKEVGQHIRTNINVSGIIIKDERVTGVRVNEQVFPTPIAISTAPVNILSQLVEGSETLNYLHDFEYSTMICITIMCLGKRVLPNAALWFPEEKFPFFRLTEPSYSMPWLSPDGKAIITADIGCKNGKENWNRTEKEWLEIIIPYLTEIIPDISQRILGCKILKTKFAYPIYLKKHEHLRAKFAKSTGIEGLYSLGRNGEFAHLLMEDVYVRTKNKMQDVIEKYKTCTI